MKTKNPIEQKATKRTKACLPLCFLCLLLLNTPTLSAEEVVVESDLEVQGNVEITGETGGTAAPGIHVTGDGGVLFEGTYGTGQIPVEGAGTRFMWYPGKAALRAGRVTGTTWDDSDIGNNSVAFGSFTTASGSYSVAMGYETLASGSGSVAAGIWTTASNLASTAMGDTVFATGNASTAMGLGATASGNFSTAMGSSTSALGAASTAMGDGASALGWGSTAMGSWTVAGSRSSVAIGQYNVSGGHPTQWNPEDPLFEIGNGTDSQNPSNALTVYKNGDMEVDGTVRVQPSGDISMGQFTD